MSVDLSKPVKTADGRRVRILCTDRQRFDEPDVGLSYCVVALVETSIGKIVYEDVNLYTKGGEQGCGHEPGSEFWDWRLVNV